MKLRPFSRSRGFTLVEVLAAAAFAGVLVALVVGFVRGGVHLNRDKAIRENLQTLWVAANQYFLENSTGEVALSELEKNGALAALKKAADEDYTKVNGGKITRDALELKLDYKVGDKQISAVYPTR
jgi:prepilin-type N-terminal cleavage/methylation domain-containing protein